MTLEEVKSLLGPGRSEADYLRDMRILNGQGSDADFESAEAQRMKSQGWTEPPDGEADLFPYFIAMAHRHVAPESANEAIEDAVNEGELSVTEVAVPGNDRPRTSRDWGRVLDRLALVILAAVAVNTRCALDKPAMLGNTDQMVDDGSKSSSAPQPIVKGPQVPWGPQGGWVPYGPPDGPSPQRVSPDVSPNTKFDPPKTKALPPNQNVQPPKPVVPGSGPPPRRIDAPPAPMTLQSTGESVKLPGRRRIEIVETEGGQRARESFELRGETGYAAYIVALDHTDAQVINADRPIILNGYDNPVYTGPLHSLKPNEECFFLFVILRKAEPRQLQEVVAKQRPQLPGVLGIQRSAYSLKGAASRLSDELERSVDLRYVIYGSGVVTH